MKIMRFIAAAALCAAAAAGAQTGGVEPAFHQAPAAASAAIAAPMSEGEVRKIDREQGKLTLRHGPIANLGMPAMTMVFRVADAGMLDRVKEGDKVRFVAQRIGGAITVTAIEPAK